MFGKGCEDEDQGDEKDVGGGVREGEGRCDRKKRGNKE